MPMNRQAFNTLVLVVDDHAPLRNLWRDFIDSLPGFEVIGESSFGQDAVLLADALQPDLVFLDIRSHERDGLAATAQIVRNQPAAGIVVHSSQSNWDHIMDAFDAGANAFLHQDDVPSFFESALRSARVGNHFISPSAHPAHR